MLLWAAILFLCLFIPPVTFNMQHTHTHTHTHTQCVCVCVCVCVCMYVISVFKKSDLLYGLSHLLSLWATWVKYLSGPEGVSWSPDLLSEHGQSQQLRLERPAETPVGESPGLDPSPSACQAVMTEAPFLTQLGFYIGCWKSAICRMKEDSSAISLLFPAEGLISRHCDIWDSSFPALIQDSF